MITVHAKALLGNPLEVCSCKPLTGFFRDGFCKQFAIDTGKHTVCAIMTDEFLHFSKEQGNDLSSARLEYDFPGLREGDKLCVCVMRWIEAKINDKAPPVILEACNESILKFVSLLELKKYTYQ